MKYYDIGVLWMGQQFVKNCVYLCIYDYEL